jgi:hypothetical protein
VPTTVVSGAVYALATNKLNPPEITTSVQAQYAIDERIVDVRELVNEPRRKRRQRK